MAAARRAYIGAITRYRVLRKVNHYGLPITAPCGRTPVKVATVQVESVRLIFARYDPCKQAATTTGKKESFKGWSSPTGSENHVEGHKKGQDTVGAQNGIDYAPAHEA